MNRLIGGVIVAIPVTILTILLMHTYGFEITKTLVLTTFGISFIIGFVLRLNEIMRQLKQSGWLCPSCGESMFLVNTLGQFKAPSKLNIVFKCSQCGQEVTSNGQKI